jgi:hypothetical integral membrane protein (TIGR02206 family)
MGIIVRPTFILFGTAHLTALALAFLAPLLLAGLARARPRADPMIRYGLAALLAGGWLAWYALFATRGWLTLSNALPLNLCDWAAAVLIAALLTRNRDTYVLGYFWGLGGTLHGLVTPDIARGFPDPQFLFFFLNHDGIIAALLYLTLGTGLRPWPGSLPRVAFASFAYAGVAGAADYLLGVNYGFLRAKPANASILDVLAPWPWYIPELVAIGLLSLLIYYLPFLLADLFKAYRTRERVSPSRTMSDKASSF